MTIPWDAEEGVYGTMREVIALKAVMAETRETANQVIGRLLVEAAKRVGTDLM